MRGFFPFDFAQGQNDKALMVFVAVVTSWEKDVSAARFALRSRWRAGGCSGGACWWHSGRAAVRGRRWAWEPRLMVVSGRVSLLGW